jgi:prophage regulatory protein
MDIKTSEYVNDVMVNGDRLLRVPEVEALRGFKRGRIYDECRQGLLTPPIKQGKRSSAWPLSEVLAINRARIAGKTDDEIRSLVLELVAHRKHGRVELECFRAASIDSL